MPFDLKTGDTTGKVTSRFLSNMKDMYYDVEAAEKIIEKKDVKVYDFTELGFDEVEQDLLFGTSIVYPGKVGDEFLLNKGTFPKKLDLGSSLLFF